MANYKPTSLSAAEAIRQMLLASDVANEVTRIFPVVSRDEAYPYIATRRAQAQTEPVKGAPGVMDAVVEVMCVDKQHHVSLSIAEMVNAALDGASGDFAGLHVRRVTLQGAEEHYDGAAFIQLLKYYIQAESL